MIDYDFAIQGVLDSDIANSEKFKLINELQIRRARDDFYAFRRYVHPGLKDSWFQRQIAFHLQQFRDDLVAGLRPKLILEAPPQHGKSVNAVDFVAWLSGHMPDLPTIYASFSERLGVRANLSLQRMFTNSKYNDVFPNTRIPIRGAPSSSIGKTRNRELLEFLDHIGCFRNTTVNGSITGEGLGLGVIDDPLKGRKEANSLNTRNKVWDWFTDDFFTRFSDDAGMLGTLTRWHVDDPMGRFQSLFPGVKVVKFKAIATEDDEFRKEGEALFPAHKSIEFLLERKKIMAAANWEALYQQSPYIQGGNIIKGENFKRYEVLPPLKYRFIIGDTAQKAKEANDYQCATVWGVGVDGFLYLIDILREKFEADELERRFPDFWHKHRKANAAPLRFFGIEDKSSGTELIQRMRKRIKPVIPVKAIPRQIDKYTRVSDVLGYIESGFVWLPQGHPGVADFIKECEEFTADDAHQHDDQVDTMVDAIKVSLARGVPTLEEML